jgi:outer membrane cobalamin receptor
MPTRRTSKLAAAVRSLCAGHRRPGTYDMGLAAVAAASLWAGTAEAQDPLVAQSDAEEITVTGSRLRRDGMSTPTPVTALDIGEMRQMAPTLLMDSLDQLPQFRDNALSQSGSIFVSGGGSNAVNLRGIGSNRTLVLLNGRRLVPGQTAGTVDVAILPTALIQRVEVVTGGASAAYGSDAISGVTNFILDTEFEGARANLQTGMTDRHDHRHYQVEFAAGSASAATSSAPSTTTTPMASWATRAATGAPRAGRCSRGASPRCRGVSMRRTDARASSRRAA